MGWQKRNILASQMPPRKEELGGPEQLVGMAGRHWRDLRILGRHSSPGTQAPVIRPKHDL